MREEATVLSNLGELRRSAGRPGAEESLRRSIAISQELTARKPAARADRQTLAIAQNNLAEVLQAAGRKEEARSFFAASIASLEQLAAENPKAVDTQNYLGYICEQQAGLLSQLGQPERARKSIESAVAHQRQAVKLTDGKVGAFRRMLAGHLTVLAKVCLKQGAYDDAIRAAVEIPKAAPSSEQGPLEAARVLAHCLVTAREDHRLDGARRDEISRRCTGRIAILLREAVDANPRLGDRLKADPDLAPILARPEFQGLLGSLVNLAPDRL